MKTIKLIFASIVLAGIFQGCSTTNWEPHRHNIQRIPRYGKNDTVINTKTKMVFVIDYEQRGKRKNQVFYAAHSLEGVKYRVLPENSIKKY